MCTVTKVKEKKRDRKKKGKRKCFTDALSSKAVHLLCTAPCLAQLSVHNDRSVLVKPRAPVKLFLNCI